MAGRKTDLTPELQKQIIDLLSVGNTIIDTCSYVGIDESSYHRWIRNGLKNPKPDNIYFQFQQSATRARSQARVGAVAMIRQSVILGNTEDARWFLERSDPERWGKRTYQRIEGNLDISIINETIRAIRETGEDPEAVFKRLVERARERQHTHA